MLALAFVSLPALAEVEGADQAFGPEAGGSHVAIEIEAAGFRLQGQRGRYTTQAISLQYAPVPYWSFEAAIPSHFLNLDTQPIRFGLGDISLGTSLELAGEDGRYELSLGAEVELPTGDRAVGLGSGNVEVTPTVGGTIAFGAFSLSLTFGATVNVTPEDSAGTPDIEYVNPDDDLEWLTHLSAVYAVTPHVFANLGIDSLHPREGVDFGQHLLRGHVGVGFAASRASRMLLEVGFPLAGPHRYEWKVGVIIQLLFNQE